MTDRAASRPPDDTPRHNPWETAALLKDRTRLAIRERYQAGESIASLAADFMVPEPFVNALVNWQLFGDTAAPIAPDDTPTRLDGVSLIAQERERQKSVEGWTVAHDDAHEAGELQEAAIAYAMYGNPRTNDEAPLLFPWPDFWKPSDDPIRNLVKAGALLAAEIDRLQRMGL